MSEIIISNPSTGGGGGGSGTVTSVAVAIGTAGTNVTVTGSPITTSGIITINIPVASAVNTGKLSNTDWSTFNNKQAALVSGTNIKTINSTTLLGSGDLAVQAVLVSGTNIKTINSNSLLGSGDIAVQATLVSGTNIKTVLGQSLLGSGAVTMSDYLGGEFKNFVPTILSGAILTINGANQDTYCGGVYGVTGAVNITIDGSVRNGFSITIIQIDANQCTFAASGAATLRNRQSHTQSAGQWAVCSLILSGTNLILTGDTA